MNAVWAGRGFHFDLEHRGIIMGVLNLTPDSFSDGGRFFDPEKAVEHGTALAAQGADIIDVGGESTRPGAQPVEAKEEVRRVVPVIKELARRLSIPIAIDTRKAVVAQAALDAGACVVNDVSGLSCEPEIAAVCEEEGAGLVLMHMRGEPHAMQDQTDYPDLFGHILDHLKEGMRKALAAGLSMEQIVVDPGIGFGKTPGQNLTIIAQLDFLKALNRPILIGVSRKSFLGKITGNPPAERLPETIAAVLEAEGRGARVHRVHDVDAVHRALAVRRAIDGRRSVAKGRRFIAPQTGRRSVS